MAKKKSPSAKKNKSVKPPENALPQNIVPVGERVEENKNIYISQSAYKAIHRFTRNKTTNESGGFLVGSIIEEFGKTNILIEAFIEAKYAQGTPTTLTFTHETWDHCHHEVEKRYSKSRIVGWIHTHPNFGIFLSEYDKFIQENFFKEDYQIAYVVDPIQNIEGFYFWINGKLERCKGFYLYDRSGVKIAAPKTQDESTETVAPRTSAKGTGLLTAAVVLLALLSIFHSLRIASLQNQLTELSDRLRGSYILSLPPDTPMPGPSDPGQADVSSDPADPAEPAPTDPASSSTPQQQE